MQRIMMMAVGWLAGWLLMRVPTLGPELAQKVAQVIADELLAWLLFAVTVGWQLLRRPGDVPAAPAAPVEGAAATAPRRWFSWLS